MSKRDDESMDDVPSENKPLLGDDEKTTAAKRKDKLLALSFIAMVVIGLGNKIFQKLQTLPMHNYPYFNLLFGTFIYIPLSFAYIVPMIFWGNQISPEQRAIPWYKFAIMGLLDGIAGLMQGFATNYIASGALIILLNQCAIPISMVISKPMVKAKYNLQHYLGAVIVVAGLVIVLIGMFILRKENGSGDESAFMVFVWCLVLMLSCVPMTLSSVYKEKALGEAEIDVVYLNGWVAVYQFAVCIALAVPAAYSSGITVNDIPTNFVDGAKCYVGHDSIHTGKDPDNCSDAPLFVTLYLGFNVLYNILIIMILKYGSANILWLAMTIMVPLGNVAFTLKFVPGHQNLLPTDIVGLVVIMSGLIIYRFWGMVRPLLDKLQNKSAYSSVN